MAKIRPDLDGVVLVRVGADVVTLSGGDDIPAGVDVGDHLVDTGGDDAARSPRGRRGAHRARSDV